MENEKIEKLLIKLAEKAAKKGEIPVSAIVIHENKIVAKKINAKERLHDVTAHAEILAIKTAAKKLKRWNLNDCTMYVTLKPCLMCMEIIKQSRIKNVYYLLEKPDYKKDYYKTKLEMIKNNDKSNTYQQLLSDFFQNIRQ